MLVRNMGNLVCLLFVLLLSAGCQTTDEDAVYDSKGINLGSKNEAMISLEESWVDIGNWGLEILSVTRTSLPIREVISYEFSESANLSIEIQTERMDANKKFRSMTDQNFLQWFDSYPWRKESNKTISDVRHAQSGIGLFKYIVSDTGKWRCVSFMGRFGKKSLRIGLKHYNTSLDGFYCKTVSQAADIVQEIEAKLAKLKLIEGN